MGMSANEKSRVIDIATGRIKPQSGMEKHFLQVLAGEAIACSVEEKVWVACYDSWLEEHVEAELAELRTPRVQAELNFGDADGFTLEAVSALQSARRGGGPGRRVAASMRKPRRKK